MKDLTYPEQLKKLKLLARKEERDVFNYISLENDGRVSPSMCRP